MKYCYVLKNTQNTITWVFARFGSVLGNLKVVLALAAWKILPANISSFLAAFWRNPALVDACCVVSGRRGQLKAEEGCGPQQLAQWRDAGVALHSEDLCGPAHLRQCCLLEQEPEVHRPQRWQL